MDEGHHGHTDLNALNYNKYQIYLLTPITKYKTMVTPKIYILNLILNISICNFILFIQLRHNLHYISFTVM